MRMAAEGIVRSRGSWLAYMRYVRGEATKIEKASHPRTLMIQGMVCMDNGRLQEALDKFHTCTRLEPADPEPLKLAAACLSKQGRHRLALEAFREANNVSTRKDPEILCSIAECMEKCGEDGVEFARAAVEAAGGEKAGTLLARLLVANGDTQSALITYDSLLQNNVCGAETLAAAGILWLRCGDGRRAFQLLAGALSLQPTQQAAALALAAMMLRHGDTDAALSRLRSVLAANPISVAGYSNLGLALLAKRKLVAAVSCVQRACWLSPLNGRAAHNAGAVFLASRRPASAFCKLASAIALEPNNAHSYLLLGIALEQLGDERADSAYNKAVELAREDDAIVILNMAARHARAGRLHEAVDKLRILAKVLSEAEILDTRIAQSAAALSVMMRDHAGMEVSAMEVEKQDMA